MHQGVPIGQPPPSTLRRLVRDTVAFDRSALAPLGGLRAGVGMGAVLVVGLAAGGPTAAVVAGVGSLIVGIVSLTGGVRPPLVTMSATALVQALSIFVGSASARLGALHLVLLVLWSFLGGLVVVLGQRATTIGLQAIIAFVVLGQFSEPPAGAAKLAGLALAGAGFQLLLTVLGRWPEALRAQRHRLAVAFVEVGALARAHGASSGIPSAEAADAAEEILAGNSLLGRDDAAALRGLLDECRRVRLAVLALIGLRRRMGPGSDPQAARLEGCLHETAAILDQVAADLTRGDARTADELQARIEAFSAAVRSPALSAPGGATLESAAADALASLAGQLRAVLALLEEVCQSSGVRLQLPSRLVHLPRAPGERLRSELAHLRANLNPRSAAFRHAARLAVTVPVSSVIGQHTPLARTYWIPLTVAVVLRPDFVGTFTRGLGRTLGTSAGVAAAGIAVATLHPGSASSIAAIAVLAALGGILFAASYAAFIACLTAMVVLLLGLIQPATVSLAVDRLIDTVIGGAFALTVYAAWPTWAAGEVRDALADLLAAQRRYLRGVLDAVSGEQDVGEPELHQLARGARLARSNAAAAVDRSLGEPTPRRIDGDRTAGILAGLRRVSEALHLLRTQRRVATGVVPAVVPLAGLFEGAMTTLARALREGGGSLELPPLRQAHDRLRTEPCPGTLWPLVVGATDEIVDALDTVGALMGVARPGSRRPD